MNVSAITILRRPRTFIICACHVHAAAPLLVHGHSQAYHLTNACTSPGQTATATDNLTPWISTMAGSSPQTMSQTPLSRYELCG